ARTRAIGASKSWQNVGALLVRLERSRSEHPSPFFARIGEVSRLPAQVGQALAPMPGMIEFGRCPGANLLKNESDCPVENSEDASFRLPESVISRTQRFGGGREPTLGRSARRPPGRPGPSSAPGRPLSSRWRLRARSFCRGAHLRFRPFALGRRILCLQNGDWQNIEQVRSRQAWPRHRLLGREYGAHCGKTFGQYPCIPGLAGGPSPAALGRAAKQPSARDDNSVSLAQPCERDDFAAVRANDSQWTIGAVGKDVRKSRSQRKQLAHQGKLDVAVRPCARKRTPIRR